MFSDTCNSLLETKLEINKKRISTAIYLHGKEFSYLDIPSRPYTLDYIKALTNDTFLRAAW